MDENIASIDQEMEAIIANSTSLQEKREVLTQIKGFGKATVTQILAFFPEIGTLGRREAASLAGLAPHPRESGKHQGYRSTKGGRKSLRNCLFMAAMSAVRYDPVIREFYLKLKDAGKKPIIALVAAMRKMIVIANAKIRDYLAGKDPFPAS
ncbi:MAG: transposase [Pseudomonadota bacterium]